MVIVKPNLNKLILSAIVTVNITATIFTFTASTEAREAKLWELYTVSVTGLYGYILASNRIVGGNS